MVELVQYIRSDSPLRWLVLFLACVALFGSYYVYDNPAALKGPLQQELKLDDFQFNLLYSVYSFPNIVLPFFGGYLVDRFGTNVTLFSFLLIICVGQTVFAVGVSTKNYEMCLIGRSIFGVGGESLSVAQTTLLALWFEGKEMAFAMGLNLSIARLGSVVNDQVSPALYTRYHDLHHPVWLGVGICVVSLTAVVLLVMVERNAAAKHAATSTDMDSKQRADEPLNCAQVVKFPAIYWLLAASCVIVYAAVLPFNNVAGGVMQEGYHRSLLEADHLLAVPFTVSAVSSPFLGGLVDKFGRRAVLLTMSAALLTAAHVFLASHYFPPLVSLLMLGVSYSVYDAAVWPSVALVIRDDQLGTAFGVVTAIQNCGLALFPILVGYIHDVTHEYFWVEMLFAGVSSVGVVIGIMINIEDEKLGMVLNSPTPEPLESKVVHTPREVKSLLDDDDRESGRYKRQ